MKQAKIHYTFRCDKTNTVQKRIQPYLTIGIITHMEALNIIELKWATGKNVYSENERKSITIKEIEYED